MLSIDEVIEDLKYDIEIDMYIHDIAPQIAEWLEELKDYQDKNKMVVRIDCANSEQFKDIAVKLAKEQYNKAIDDFVKEICKMIVQSENNGNHRFYAVEIKQAIADLAEQLKIGGENE